MRPNLKFKKLRESLSLSQAAFAAKLGVSQGTIGDIERGRIGISKNVQSKIIEKINLQIGYFDSEKSIKNEEMKQGSEIGWKQGFRAQNSTFQERRLTEVAPYLRLNDRDLDYEIESEIKDWKLIWDDYKKLLEAIYKLEPPAFFKTKFTLPPDFEKYKENIESEYSPRLDNNGKENSFTKIDKILNLYREQKEHRQYLLSILIDYFNRYSDFFLDDNELKQALKE